MSIMCQLTTKKQKQQQQKSLQNITHYRSVCPLGGKTYANIYNNNIIDKQQKLCLYVCVCTYFAFLNNPLQQQLTNK